MNIGFLASHNGSNFQAIVDACKSGKLVAKPAALISNNNNSGAAEKARGERIPVYHLSHKTHPRDGELDTAILNLFKKHDVEIVVLAGYMKKLGPKTLAYFRGSIYNIHPALLPKYGGRGMYGINVHRAVIEAGEMETGVTVHLVDQDYDTGPIVSQIKIPILPDDTPETLQQRVLEYEHSFFPQVLQKIVMKRRKSDETQ